MKKKVISAALAGTLAVSLLSACGASNEPQNISDVSSAASSEATSTTASSESTGDAAQELTFVLSNIPDGLDPSVTNNSFAQYVLINCFEGLVTYDSTGTLVPGNAESWDISDDGLTYTFHLRDGLKWSDGSDLTAEDYVYTIQRVLTPATAAQYVSMATDYIKNAQEYYDGTATADDLGVKALDDKTLEITLAYPMASFLEMCSGTIYYPQRQDMMEKYGEKYGTEAEYTMGNGPYMMESWVHNSKIVLKKNPYYWNAENVSLETVNLSILSDSTTIYNGFESYELDYCSTSEAEWIDKFMSYSDVVYQITPSATLAYSFYNTKDAIFSNANIRKAFTLAMDREELNDMCFGGANVPTYGWICPAISVGETNFREYAGQTIQEMTDEMTKEGLTAKDYLLKGMEELGLGNDPATLKVAFSLAGTDEWFRTFGEYLQQSYKATLGVNMEISFNNWDIFYDNVQKGNFQIGYMAWGAYYNDPYDMLSLFNSANDSIQTGWANAEFDQLVEAALSEQDETKRLEMYKKAEDILLRQDCAVCPVLTFTNNSFYRSYVKGYGELAFSITGYKGLSTGERPQ